jgi:hypothetical protein
MTDTELWVTEPCRCGTGLNCISASCPKRTVRDDGGEFRIVRGTLSNDLFVVDRMNQVHASFARWHADLAEETLDRLNIRRLAGRG